MKEKLAEKKKVEEEEDSEPEDLLSESEEEIKPKLSGKRAKPENNKPSTKTAPPKNDQPEPSSDEDEEGEEQEVEEDDEKKEKESDKEENEAKEEESQEEAKEEEAKGEETGEIELFLGNLPFNATQEDLESFFAEYGEVVSVKILMRNNKAMGKAFVRFANHEDAVKAKEANGKDFNGREIIVRFASEPQRERSERPERQERQERPPRQSNSNETTIFIGGLSYQSTQDSVSEFFANCGNITAVRIATNPDGNPKGFAHVEFDSLDAVQEALKLSGSELDGRKIRIDVAGNKSGSGGFRGAQRGGSRGNHSFGGRGRFDGGRRGDRRGRPGLSGVVNKNKGASQQFQGKKMRL